MGYPPMGVQGDAISMQRRKNELLEIQKYLENHPDIKEHQGFTREQVCQEINNIDSFEFLSWKIPAIRVKNDGWYFFTLAIKT